MAYHFKEPLGVVGQIIPWNFPLLMAAWKIAPAIGAGNCTVIKPASNTPLSLLMLMDLIADVLPAGVVNVVTGPGGEIGEALAKNPRIAKVAFTGETTTGRQIMRYAAERLGQARAGRKSFRRSTADARAKLEWSYLHAGPDFVEAGAYAPVRRDAHADVAK